MARGDADEGAGLPSMLRYLEDPSVRWPPFACPFLVDGTRVIGQTAAILLYLGGRLKLAPAGEADRLWLHQIRLTLADLVAEAHDLHHPIASGLYYEDQKAEALRRAQDFRRNRLPKFLGWCEAVLARNPGNAARGAAPTGARLSYADLSLFQVVEGLLYALPKATRRAAQRRWWRRCTPACRGSGGWRPTWRASAACPSTSRASSAATPSSMADGRKPVPSLLPDNRNPAPRISPSRSAAVLLPHGPLARSARPAKSASSLRQPGRTARV